MISPVARLIIAIVAVATTGCLHAGARTAACNIDRMSMEREVRAVSAKYASVRDAETEIAQYTDDVWFFSTLTPVPTVGRGARRQSIERRRAPVPGEFTRRETTGVLISQCGDLAVEHGRYVTSWPTAAGIDSVAGYYLLTYRRIGSDWKVAAASVHRRPAAELRR